MCWVPTCSDSKPKQAMLQNPKTTTDANGRSVVGPTIAPFSSTLFINARSLTHSPSLLASPSLPSPALYLFFAVSSSSDSFHSNISPQLAPQLTFRGFFGQTLGACSSLGEWSGGHQGRDASSWMNHFSSDFSCLSETVREGIESAISQNPLMSCHYRARARGPPERQREQR